MFFADKPTVTFEDAKPPTGVSYAPTASYPSPPAYHETQPNHFLTNKSSQFKDNYNNALVHPVTTPYVPPPSTRSNVDVSRVKQEPGCHTDFAFDPSRRTVSLDEPYPFYVKTERHPMMGNASDNIRRQMSLPVYGDYNLSMNSEHRRSSEPAIPAFKSFPLSHSFPSPGTPNTPSTPFSRGQSHLPYPTNMNEPNPDLYYVNLASYRHHRELETQKRRELTKGRKVVFCNVYAIFFIIPFL